LIRSLLLTMALLSGASSALAEKQVTPGQIKALQEEIADIDEWLDDAEDDRSSLERQLADLERNIGRLTHERRELRKQAGPAGNRAGADSGQPAGKSEKTDPRCVDGGRRAGGQGAAE
jgi:septal ring factor EnvC (AmiA/AmiB activator)